MGCGSSSPVTSPPRVSTIVQNPVAQESSVSIRRHAEERSFKNTWKKLERLGQGQYATVYKCENISTGAIAAVKEITKATLTKEDLEALAVEVKAMELLRDHANFVKIIDFFNERKTFFIVLELVTGGELFERIVQKAHYSEREARAVFKQMVSGIATAHQRHICHRDLKPENVLLASKTDDTTIKLADLGFAKILPAANSLMTTPCGTPGYVAPEVIATPSRGYSTACDVWSMGVILFILLVGQPPFHSDKDDQSELFEQIKSGRFEMNPRDWAEVSEDAKELVKRILVVDPTRRITAHQILNHRWMKIDSEQLRDKHLGGTMSAMKRFVARRRLRKAIRGVLTIVRMKLMMAGSASSRARSRGANADEQEAAFFAAAQTQSLRPEQSEYPDAYLGANRPMRTAGGR